MMTPAPAHAEPATLDDARAESLAARLMLEMADSWRRGERRLVENFLDRHPELWQHPGAAADLIYEELSLREEFGVPLGLEDLLGRFPQWRRQLEVLFDCQRLLGAARSEPHFPPVGECLGDFHLLAELGRGAQGRVFLARQLSLGDRPVVLKLTPAEADEHLCLARLQHTHIVPLYSVQDYPERRLRALCMPYFGGATLVGLLQALHDKPPCRRSGKDILSELDRAQASLPVGVTAAGPARQGLNRASYVQVVCWLGACLADALQYAHERGLVHLDLKPSNILLAADGQPMLLDFHLAQAPITPEGAIPRRLGCTTDYASPEQQRALEAVQLGRKLEGPVDARSDVYSLGVVLYESLAGELPAPGKTRRSLRRVNSQVSVGLADIIAKCLSTDPDDRYPDAAALATDLRRHLAHLPLIGVWNRSLRERWQKWRRRRPQGLVVASMVLTVFAAMAILALGLVEHLHQRTRQARFALKEGQAQMGQRAWDAAIGTFERGQATARTVPFQAELAGELGRHLQAARQAREAAARAEAVRDLHVLLDRIRCCYGTDSFPRDGLRNLEACCRDFWAGRNRILDRTHSPDRSRLEPEVREDLLDLAIFFADLQKRLALPGRKGEARRQALEILDEAEEMFGPSAVLDLERQYHLRSGCTQVSDARPARISPPEPLFPADAERDSAWEHYALARALLRAGDVRRAVAEAERAVRIQPQGLWPNFYLGLCAYQQGRHLDAALAYSVCIGAAPEVATCFVNRGLALDGLGRSAEALADYNRAFQLDPALNVAVLNRGVLHYRQHRYDAALADLRRARELGAEPSVVAFDLALVHLARGERTEAREELCLTLLHDPRQEDARRLLDGLSNR